VWEKAREEDGLWQDKKRQGWEERWERIKSDGWGWQRSLRLGLLSLFGLLLLGLLLIAFDAVSDWVWRACHTYLAAFL
jgi:hypothetical protein